MTTSIKYVCNAIKWRDKINGNTYHSVKITRVKDKKVIYGEFQYGYGDQYKSTALDAMADAKWLPVKYRKENEANGFPYHTYYERENDYPILWNVSHGLKREAIKNGGA